MRDCIYIRQKWQGSEDEVQGKTIVIIEVVVLVLHVVLFVCLFSFTPVVESFLSLFLLLGAVFFLLFNINISRGSRNNILQA